MYYLQFVAVGALMGEGQGGGAAGDALGDSSLDCEGMYADLVVQIVDQDGDGAWLRELHWGGTVRTTPVRLGRWRTPDTHDTATAGGNAVAGTGLRSTADVAGAIAEGAMRMQLLVYRRACMPCL